MVLQSEENKGVELTVYVCKGLVAMECGRGGVNGERSTPGNLRPKGVAAGERKELVGQREIRVRGPEVGGGLACGGRPCEELGGGRVRGRTLIPVPSICGRRR